MQINGINAEIFEQYDIIRRSGMTNMLDQSRVLSIAQDMDLDELVTFMKLEKTNYANILKNFSAAKKAGVI